MTDTSKTYWENAGLLQAEATALNELIPFEGAVEKPRSANRSLERFRRASNCYYDLYNNGLCNRANEFRKIFGLASTKFLEATGRYRRNRRGYTVPVLDYSQELYDQLEARMSEIILDAAIEQGVG